MIKPLIITFVLCSLSVLAGSAAIILADFGAPVWVFVALLGWLLTFGFPTTCAMLLVASYWSDFPLILYLAVTFLVALMFQWVGVYVVQRTIDTLPSAESRMRLTRRAFVAGTAFAATSLALEGVSQQAPKETLVDFHVHLFGIGNGGTGCYFSEAQKRHINIPYFLQLLGLSENGRIDQDYLSVLISQLHASSVDRVVLVAQDGRYTADGFFDKEATHFYVPNNYLLQVTRVHPDVFVPCISINPSRRDWLDELDQAAEGGAKVLKIHPPTQAVDPGEERFRPFYQRIKEHGILLMVHTGAEHSSDIVGDKYSDPSRLRLPLEEGCTVIAAHSGMGAFFDNKDLFEGFFQSLVALIAEFSNLYCDSAVLASMFRWRNLPRILEEPTVVERLVHASDYPFPSNGLVFWNHLSPLQLLTLCSETNLFERDYRLKQALGVDAKVFKRGAELLGIHPV